LIEQVQWNIDVENEAMVRKTSLRKINDDWRNFKTTLTNKYVRTNKSPLQKYSKWMNAEKWEVFKQQKMSEAFQVHFKQLPTL
jgi:hypothetical protein